MGISNFALDGFVSQELSKLTACEPKSLADEFPNREDWATHFVLRRIFHNHIPEERAALALVLLRRTDAAVDEWELACQVTKGEVRKPGPYFKLLRHLENCITALWQGLDFAMNAHGSKFFEKGDGSVYERLNWIYNVSRHFDPQSLPVGDLHRLWVTNDGLHSREHAVTFDEIRSQIQLLARVVDKVAGPQ